VRRRERNPTSRKEGPYTWKKQPRAPFTGTGCAPRLTEGKKNGQDFHGFKKGEVSSSLRKEEPMTFARVRESPLAIKGKGKKPYATPGRGIGLVIRYGRLKLSGKREEGALSFLHKGEAFTGEGPADRKGGESGFTLFINGEGGPR